jgi:O-antigen/teichoic acid export membrane protein
MEPMEPMGRLAPDPPLADATGDRLIKSVLALLTSSVAGALLGLVFWAVAAHLYPARSVGYGVAAIAAMTLLANVAQLNLGTVFPRYLYASGARVKSVLVSGYATSVLMALLAGTLFVVLTGAHPYLARDVFPAPLFVVAVVIWVVFTIQDSALTGLRATFWVPVENTSFSLIKIALLPVFAAVAPVSGVFVSWTLPVITCIVPVSYFLFRKVVPRHVSTSAGRGSLPQARVVGSVLAGEYVGSLSFIALTCVPALLVLARLGAKQTAYFQTPWLIGTSFDFLLFAIASSLLVESSARPTVAHTLVPRAVRLGCLMLIPGCIVLLVGAPMILSVLGHQYAAQGTSLLRWLALALPFMGINVLYTTFARMGRRMRRIVAHEVSLAVLILSLTALLIGHIGIAGAGAAFTAGQALVACVVLPSVVRQYRRAGMAPGFAPAGALVVRDATQAAEATEVAGALAS